MRRRLSLPVYLLLILALAWSQWAGLVHGVSHGLGGEKLVYSQPPLDRDAERGSHSGNGVSHTCVDCLAFSAFAAALTSRHTAVATDAPRASFLSAHPAGFNSAFRPAYRSRAPPSLS